VSPRTTHKGGHSWPRLTEYQINKLEILVELNNFYYYFSASQTIRSPNSGKGKGFFSLCQNVQPGNGGQPSLQFSGWRSLIPLVAKRLGYMVSHFNIVPRLGTSGAELPLLLYNFMLCRKTSLSLYLFYVTFRFFLEDCFEITNSGCYKQISSIILYVTVSLLVRKYWGYLLIYLLTAIGLSPGASSTVHIYTQTIHRTTQ